MPKELPSIRFRRRILMMWMADKIWGGLDRDGEEGDVRLLLENLALVPNFP